MGGEPGWGQESSPPPPTGGEQPVPKQRGRVFSEQQLQQGKLLYQKKCALCHGESGDGKGSAADLVDPKPRDFTSGTYKLRSTPSGELPADEDLFRVITRGMPGTAMPSWSHLSEEERWNLVAYVKTFSERFNDEEVSPPLKVGQFPLLKGSALKEAVERGKKLFTEAKCWECHGKGGRGNGPASPTLADEWGNKIRPADLTNQWGFRGGNSEEDIFRTISTGLNGTPMPSYSEVFDEKQRRDLTTYVKSLSQRDTLEVKGILRAKKIRTLPSSPDDPLWLNAEEASFPLVGQVVAEPRWFTPSVDLLSVRALYSETSVALLFSWTDPTKDVSSPQPADALALQLPAQTPTAPERPYFGMGDPQHPVVIWYWKGSGPFQKLIGSGFRKKLLPHPVQDLRGTASYDDGQWKVMVSRNLSPGKGEDIAFLPGKFFPVSFAVWDGSRNEKGAQKAVSTWYFLLLDPPRSAVVFIIPVLAAAAAVFLELYAARKVKNIEL